MASSLQSILPRILAWPQEDQDALVQAALQIEAAREGEYILSAEEEQDIKDALAQAERGEFASEAEIAALFGRSVSG